MKNEQKIAEQFYADIMSFIIFRKNKSKRK